MLNTDTILEITFEQDNRIIVAPAFFPIISYERWLEHKHRCETVSDLQVEDIDGRNALVHWQGRESHCLYEVAYGPADSDPESYPVDTVSDTAYTLRLLNFGQQYALRVRALCCHEDTIQTWSPWCDTMHYQRPSARLNLLCNDTSWGHVDGSGDYEPGITITVEAVPNADCSFLGWDDSVGDNPRSITILCDTTFTALFAPPDTTAIDGTDAPTLVLLPNPATGLVLLQASEAMTHVAVRDMQGRTLLVAEPKANELPFSVADWPAGTYLVTVRTARATASRKLVKQ